ncbi:indole-3-glycerol phosphate synthase [Siphonobacter sp. BAB-5385]|uniref:indole-3-glycerol phosphate synthase TrpC n=1 Tax=Siphonobacter sp. BAB-5385 TaxID=1864822 RepID=UPI000B9ECE12|nr:indole-3-glycerol phosphate synthase TrpC [Siphonobacter sp. BAB-5385]OZI06070.1 indole-3-glycerol phosphate synthase [Siphonobacter sp. BAB-5385]
MNILEKIVLHKRKEISQAKANIAARELELFPAFSRTGNSLSGQLRKENSTGIIAEFKRKSPSKGTINDRVQVEEVTLAYAQAGAAGLSVLTDEEFFGGDADDLKLARKSNPKTPILRKDFIVDEYQILEAKAWGADVILLIAACLSPEEIKHLGQFAQSLNLEVLLEVHDQEELERSLNPHLNLVGVNNRDLKTFQVSVDTSLQLVEQIPHEFVKVSESGLSSVETIHQLYAAGYRGFLIGENFMKTPVPGNALADLVGGLQYVTL